MRYTVCISLSFLCNPYIPFLIYEILNLLVYIIIMTLWVYLVRYVQLYALHSAIYMYIYMFLNER